MKRIEIYSPKTDRTRKYDLDMPLDMVRFVAREMYAFPGGYELCLIANDGGLICPECVKANYRNIIDSTKTECNDGWQAAGIVADCELEDCRCDNCYKALGYETETTKGD